MIRTLTGRAMLVTALVAVVAVMITAAVALPVTLRAASAEARQALAEQADLAARIVGAALARPAEQAPEPARLSAVIEALAAEGVEVLVIRDGEPDRPGFPQRVVAEVVAGRPVSQTVVWNGRVLLAEGRPAASPGAGIVLLAPPSAVSLRTVLGRLWLALVCGLLAGVAAGALLARRLGRPLREAAATARRLSAGDRTVRASPEAPEAPDEVAAVSAALNDLAAALATSERRQRTFLTSISHELRTPLTTMKGYAEALADGVIAGEEARRAGQTMLAESQHLDRLVEDLLALARLEADDFPLAFAPVDLVGIVVAAGQSWGPRCAAIGVPLRVDAPAHPVLAYTDAGRVRQVLDGLLENALRAVPSGAPVVISVADVAGQPALEVRDGGPGFTEDDLAVVFEQGALHARYRGVRKVGSGLGLALAHRLVARLGGRIEAGHAPEGGARMTVRLPAART